MEHITNLNKIHAELAEIYLPYGFFLGKPISDTISSEKLEEMGFVGLYKDPKLEIGSLLVKFWEAYL
jgi:hypothetical protein